MNVSRLILLRWLRITHGSVPVRLWLLASRYITVGS
jgi:hypothetical protein